MEEYKEVYKINVDNSCSTIQPGLQSRERNIQSSSAHNPWLFNQNTLGEDSSLCSLFSTEKSGSLEMNNIQLYRGGGIM